MKYIIAMLVLSAAYGALAVMKPKSVRVIEPVRHVCVMLKYEGGQVRRIPLACKNKRETYKGDLKK